MHLLPACLSIVLGYLLGSISPARVVTARVAPQQDISKLVVEGLDGKGRFESDSVSSGSVRLHLGNKYGCLVGILDILKGAIPTLVLKWWLPDQPYYLLAAGMVVVGHNWPVYYRFHGGRGISPCLGSMLVVDWRGAVVTNILGLMSDVFIRMPLITSGVWLVLMVPWIWIVRRSLPERIYVMAMALIYSASMLPEWREIIRLKREGNLKSLRTAREVKVSSRAGGGTAQQASVRDVISELISRLRRRHPDS
jgi:acyl phosphate:glycerol-3-phosphate acyltransferase